MPAISPHQGDFTSFYPEISLNETHIRTKVDSPPPVSVIPSSTSPPLPPYTLFEFTPPLQCSQDPSVLKEQSPSCTDRDRESRSPNTESHSPQNMKTAESGFVSSRMYFPPPPHPRRKLFSSESSPSHDRRNESRSIHFVPRHPVRTQSPQDDFSPTRHSQVVMGDDSPNSQSTTHKPHYVFVPQRPRPLVSPQSGMTFDVS